MPDRRQSAGPRLWRAVLLQALRDAASPATRLEAAAWAADTAALEEVCALADADPRLVRTELASALAAPEALGDRRAMLRRQKPRRS